jgi:hypothetical protein
LEYLLADPQLQTLLSANQNRQDEITKAAAQFAADRDVSDDQLLPAVLKASNAIIHGIRIFISHKVAEADTAALLRDILFRFCRTRLALSPTKPNPFVASYGTTIQPGSNWRDEIFSTLKTTHWFFLILPEENLDRDWLIFEVGYFGRGMLPGDKLICIHREQQRVPDQISHLQAIPATVNRLSDLLISLVKQDHAVPGMNAIDEYLDDRTVTDNAQALAKLFKREINPPFTRQYYIPFVNVDLRGIVDISNRVELNELKILLGSDGANGPVGAHLPEVQGKRGIFDVATIPPTFGGLITNILRESGEQAWLDQLAEAIGRRLRGGNFDQPTACLKGAGDGRYYRPSVNAFRITEGDKLHSVHIVFMEETIGEINRVPADLATLEAVLRLGYRFRWEILEEYVGLPTPKQIDALERVLRAMEAESDRRSLRQPVYLPNLFQGPDQERVREMYEEYMALRNPTTSEGKLDRAFRDHDSVEVLKALEILRPMNREFMRMASRRYAELVAERW